ncbi:WD repeat-containing protein 49 isoform X3 [Cynoglossus semilaevis]|nr:WD repeat-containing protein 49-like isoform X3 [Cynoglossus semilaevis]
MKKVTKLNPWITYETEVQHSRFCDPACGPSPAEKLTPQHLKLLRDAFTRPRPAAQKHDRIRKSRRADVEDGVRFEEFQQVLRTVIGPDIEDTWVDRFFCEVDISCSGQVTWKQLCSYLLLEFTERERASVPTAALLQQPHVQHCSHNKRETTVRVVAVSYPPPLRYLSISKGGQVTMWNSSLHILRSIGLAGDMTEEVAHTRRFRGWVTDVVYMGSVHRVAVATDSRDLHFINVSTANIFEEIHVYGFRSVPTALCYWNDAQCPDRPPLLMLGDEKGGVHLMWFLYSSKGLFVKTSKKQNSCQRHFFPDLCENTNIISHRYIPNIHLEPITKVMFDPGSNVIMTSSQSDCSSVVFLNLTLKREPYVWRINQGVKCFDYSASLQLMVTGGSDRAVRFWSRFVTTRPVSTLLGHCSTVLDVAIYQPMEQIFSYSRDAELRIWDISSHHCLKTIHLQFPCLQLGRIPEHGNFPFLLVAPRRPAETQPHLLVACKDYLALLKLARTRGGRGGEWLTDEDGGPGLSCALYNPTLRQVVTGHMDSSVSLWEVETGRRRLQIVNAHGEEELLCMTLDSTHRRLITGAGNGTIKVWNLLNGLNLHKLEPVSNSDVSKLICLKDNKLLAVGRSRRIVQYDIAAAKDMYVNADLSWKSTAVHQSDVLAVCECSALGVVATADQDGEVIVWRVDTQGPLLHLHTQTQAGVSPPVDNLLFLQHRAQNRKQRNRGVLVSSSAGSLCFWSICGAGHTYGQFYAPEQPRTRVLSVSSDQAKNTILVSGDTTGWLQIWDITDYAVNEGELFSQQPPLLQRWRAHKQGVVKVEVLEVEEAEKMNGSFIFSASADGSAALWTKDGDLVRSFGQEVMWNLMASAKYQR